MEPLVDPLLDPDDAAERTASGGATGSAAPARAEPGVGRSSVRGFLWTTLAWGGNRLVILGLTLLLARLLTPEDFGIVTAALTILAMLDAALDLGVGAAVIQSQERGVTRQTRTAFTLNLGISALIAVLGAASSPLIARLFHAEAHVGVFALIFLYPLFRGAGQVNDALLKRDLLFKRRTLIDLARALVRVAVSVPLALTIGGPVSIAAGIVTSEFVAMIALWLMAPIRPDMRPTKAGTKELLGFGGQVTVIRLLGSFRSSFDYVVVGSMLGATALGFYGMAYKLPELVIENVLWIFSAIALSAYSRARANGHDALIHTMLRATRLLALYGLAAGAALCVVARDAIPVLFSARWTPAVVPMMLIALSLGIMAIPWASGDVFSAMGRPGTLVKLDLPMTVLMAGAFLVAPRWGLTAVAAVHLVFNVVYCLTRLTLVKFATRVSARSLLAAVLPGVGVALVTAAVGFGVSSLLPSGKLLSLVLVSAACAVGIAGGSLLFARDAVLQLVRMALPGRPPRPARRAREVHS